MFRMLDLFSGLGGASQAMFDRGWEVVRVDNNSDFNPDYCVDILSWVPSFDPGSFDLVWASPPCTHFSRYIQRGVFLGEPLPSLDLYNASRRIIAQLRPTYWVIENVRGAVRFFGPGFISYGPYFIWSNLPELPVLRSKFAFNKSRVTVGHSRRASERSKIPYRLSFAVAEFIERQIVMPFYNDLCFWEV